MINNKSNSKLGATIIESIVAIGLLSFFTAIFGTSYVLIATNNNYKFKTLAFYLAQEEIEALRSANFNNLTNRTAADFIDVTYNLGNWAVQSDNTAPSSPNTISFARKNVSETGISGFLSLPGFEYSNFTYLASIKINSNSPLDWKAGLALRYRDNNNYYSLNFNSSDISLDLVNAGVETNIGTEAQSFSINTWYDLKVIATNNAFDIYINDVLVLTATDSSSTFSEGRNGMFSYNDSEVRYDDISITQSGTLSWNFDGNNAGSLPVEWRRYGINNLPAGTSKLTITDPADGNGDIKEVTARVEWTHRSNTRYVELTTLISH